MLTDMYSLVETVTGSMLTVWGLALLINGHIVQSFFQTFTDMKENETLSGLSASMFLILGFITIYAHNDWYFNTGIIVTALGWIITIKAGIWLLFPVFMAEKAKKLSKLVLHSYFRFASGGVFLILGLVVLSAQIKSLF